MLLQMPVDLQIPRFTEPYRNSVNLILAADDGMYDGNDRHYLSCGASALNVILSTLRLADAPGPAAILDFGAGAGRVTRWIRAAFPKAAIDACDLRASDMEFCARTFGARTWISGTDIDSLEAPGTYDLIWVGSVITHLNGDKMVRLLDKLVSWTRPGGAIVMSFHGRYALVRQDSGEFRYNIDDQTWESIKSEYARSGYGYADYSGQQGYGISITKPSWMAATVENRELRLISLSERAWDDHHDILAVQARFAAPLI